MANLSQIISPTGAVSINATQVLTNKDLSSGTNTFPASLTGKQAALVSGTNIKTVGGTTLLGSGDLVPVLPVVSISGTTQTAVSGNHYVTTNVGATTVTLPATPASGDMVIVTFTNGLTTNIIARNGSTIAGASTDLTMDVADLTVSLRYLNASWRIM